MSQVNILASKFLGNYSFSLFAYSLPYLYVFNMVLFFFLLKQKRKILFLIPAFSLVFTTSLFFKVFAFHFFDAQKVEKSDSDLKVLSWNVGLQGLYLDGGKKKKLEFQDSMLEAVKSVDPDVVCFQEFIATDSDDPRATFHVDSVAAKLEMPYYFFAYDSIFDFQFQMHYGNVIFSKYPIVQNERISFERHVYNNNVAYADILIAKEKQVRIATFHFESLRLNTNERKIATDPTSQSNRDSLYKYSKSIYQSIMSSYSKRVQQARAVEEIIESTDKPIFVCGDMNDVASSYAYFLARADLYDAFLSSGKGFGKTFSSAIPSLRIDYLFYNPEYYSCCEYKTMKLPFSDHYPICSVFKIKPKSNK